MTVEEIKFEYGNKSMAFNPENMVLDYVANNHELTYWEKKLDDYAVYTVSLRTGGKVTGKSQRAWALITTQELLDNFYTQEVWYV